MRAFRWWQPFPLFLYIVVVLLCPAGSVHAAQGSPPIRIIFMHHSTGQGLLDAGDLRAQLTALGYELWDHGYNEDGLTDGSGTRLGENWNVPDDNTDPSGWAAIFQQPVTSPAANTFSHMLEFDVILFKSCFPVSDIQSDAQLDEYRAYFLSIRAIADQHPDKLFIPFTLPPLVPVATTPEAAARAMRWADFMTSSEYLSGHPNLVVFDLFSQLADMNGFLRADYRGDIQDSHPNDEANRVVGRELAAFVDDAIRSFRPGAVSTELQSAQAVTMQPESTISAISDGSASLWSLDFEQPLAEDDWWTYTNEGTLRFECAQASPGYMGTQALQLTFQFSAGGNAGCGIDAHAGPTWSRAQALRFVYKASQPGLSMRVAFGVKDTASLDSEPTPFQIDMLAQGTDWTEVTFPLAAFTKPEWFSDGVDALEPTSVVWIDFDVGQWDAAQSGVIWFDQVELLPCLPPFDSSGSDCSQ